jgi:enoyl-CoA hydratase
MMSSAADPGRILLDVGAGMARVTIDRTPHLNALNSRLRVELVDAVERAAADPAVRVIVLAGAGRRAFVAGADIEELIDLTPAGSVDLSETIAVFHERLDALPIPVIAAIRGWCLGGGLELALAADIRIAAATSRLGLPEIRLGILPGGGGIARLNRLAGPTAARHLCLTGAIIDARRALEIGLVSEVHEEDAFDARIDALASSLAASGRAALAGMKAALRIDGPLAAAIRAEAAIGAALYGTPEQRTAMTEFLADRARHAAR